MLNHSKIFNNTPRIFIQVRKKNYIIKIISKIIKHDKIVFIDDNFLNITDALKLKFNNFEIINYTKHNNHNNIYITDDITKIKI